MSKDYASMFLGSIEGFVMLCSGNNMYKISDVTHRWGKENYGLSSLRTINLNGFLMLEAPLSKSTRSIEI